MNKGDRTHRSCTDGGCSTASTPVFAAGGNRVEIVSNTVPAQGALHQGSHSRTHAPDTSCLLKPTLDSAPTLAFAKATQVNAKEHERWRWTLDDWKTRFCTCPSWMPPDVNSASRLRNSPVPGALRSCAMCCPRLCTTNYGRATSKTPQLLWRAGAGWPTTC